MMRLPPVADSAEGACAAEDVLAPSLSERAGLSMGRMQWERLLSAGRWTLGPYLGQPTRAAPVQELESMLDALERGDAVPVGLSGNAARRGQQSAWLALDEGRLWELFDGWRQAAIG